MDASIGPICQEDTLAQKRRPARVVPISDTPAKVRPQRCMPANQQRSLAGRYPLWIKGLSLLAFAWAFLGWLNETWFFQFNNPIWLNRYTEYVIILIFGIWRIVAEKNPYSRKRLIILVANVTVLWWLIPWSFPFIEPYVGYLGVLPAFPSLHTPGTLTFFLVLGAVFLFGRRVICGWNCPCVSIREVVGFPFRQADHVPRGPWAWRLRHLKWFWLALYLGAMWAMLRPANNTTTAYLGFFGLMVALPYFLTFFLAPWIGNRSYCRYLCPYGATFGVLNRVGSFQIDYNKDSCIQCGLCEKVCDMGIPVWHMGAETGKVDTSECMGCGRCITECPSKSLAFHDVRNLLFPRLHQDREWLRGLVDWQRSGTRWRTALFALVLAGALAGAWHYSGRIGSGAELINNLGTLCGLPISKQ
ncbi:MAG: 4Fe-4S binding protein [Magnetococcales bacterium]|nr:4Fe-4S binding protein [Magnetococcales bacterium]MBF0115221.1 4Fe-4S binding protein [Magnetococcales bacterium]